MQAIIAFILLVMLAIVQQAQLVLAQVPTSSPKANTEAQNNHQEQDLTSTNKAIKPLLDDKLIIIGTGTLMGVYYPAGGAICRIVNKERRTLGIRCAVEATQGSIYNVEALEQAEVDLSIIQSDWQEHVYNGTGIFGSKGRYEKLRHVFALHNEAITVIVTKSSKINKFDDIRGHIVNFGPEGSGIRSTMEDVMKAKGWKKTDFQGVSELPFAEQPKALCNGNIDVMVLATGHPNGLVQEASTMCEVKILDVNDDTIKKFVAGNPQFSTAVIPGGLYAGIPNDVHTFGVRATLVTSSELSDYIVYNVTKIVFDNLKAFKAMHPVFADLDPIKMATEGRTAPYHPGAFKYYREVGLVKE
jgi:TRAP transporter TAXI family solute receptor